jgi:ATP-binding cassette subfamily B protein/subfamily B ATP-binding cassette protein MsbA
MTCRHSKPGAGAPILPGRSPTLTECYGLAWRYCRPYRGRWAVAGTMTLLATVLAMLQPWPIQFVIDYVLGGKLMPAWVERCIAVAPGASDPIGLAAYAAAAGLLCYLVSAAVDVKLTYCWIETGQRMVYDLAQDLFAAVQRRSLLFHRSTALADVMSRVTADSWCIYKLVDALLMAPAKAMVFAIGVAAIMFQINASLAGVALLAAPLMAVATVMFGKRLRSASREQLAQEIQIQSHVQQVLSGLNVVQSFGQEHRENREFIDFAGSVVRARQKSALVSGLAELSTGLASVVGSAAVLWVGSRLVLSKQLTLGELLVFLAYLTSLHSQLKSFCGVYSTLQTVRASVERVIELLGSAPEIRERPGAISLDCVKGHIQIENAWFTYKSDDGFPVLKSVSLEARPGEMIAIVGPTGAGKSTLLGLAWRMYDPDRGRVLIDGVDIRDLTLASLRRNIAVVQQDLFLLPTTIAENISFGRPDASMREIVRAARAAGAHDFIDRLPEGYQTILGQRGATLSGGERQRLAIARAILKDAPILLMDEPTSGLDAQTEQAVLGAMRQLMKGRTVIVIAHRLSTVRRADSIVVLERGQVVEQGKHDALLCRAGTYARFHAIHAGDSEQVLSEAGCGR